MALVRTLLYGILVSVCNASLKFPPDFIFGASTSAYQIEGAWNVSDKSENIWDKLTHTLPERIKSHNNGDVACDSYYQWQADIDAAADLGLQAYRFSLSWSRILPSGFPNHISEDGKNYYNRLIDGLLAKGIEPAVTIYHWDLPQRLQDLGGWANPLIAEWFADYARVVYTLFGDRVKIWFTINEPIVVCDMSYSHPGFAPNVVDKEIAVLLCNKNLLIAHAKAWRIYDEEFRSKYNGKVSVVNHMVWFEGKTKEDQEAGELANIYYEGRYGYPIFSKEGGWPPIIEKIVAESSRKAGFPSSRLPAFTKDEIDLVKGTYDFYAVNHYTSRLVRPAKPGEQLLETPLHSSKELNIVFEIHPDWKPAAVSWFKRYPEGLRKALVWLRDRYGDIPFLITENGYASGQGLEDYDRVECMKDYMEQVLLAIHEDKVNVTAYMTWSLIDNFEWVDGFHTRFGLYEVDFENPKRPRTARVSAKYYAQIIKERSLGPNPRVSEEL